MFGIIASLSLVSSYQPCYFFLAFNMSVCKQFYMKTGVCKYGSTCKFHHPKDISGATGGVGNTNVGQIEGITGGTAGSLAPLNPPVTPALLHNSKGLPIRPVIHLHTFD